MGKGKQVIAVSEQGGKKVYGYEQNIWYGKKQVKEVGTGVNKVRTYWKLGADGTKT